MSLGVRKICNFKARGSSVRLSEGVLAGRAASAHSARPRFCVCGCVGLWVCVCACGVAGFKLKTERRHCLYKFAWKTMPKSIYTFVEIYFNTIQHLKESN